jgi:hypothetical protein
VTCPGGCGGDPFKGGCGCWIDDDFLATQAEALAEGYPVGPRETEGGGSSRVRRDLKPGKERR